MQIEYPPQKIDDPKKIVYWYEKQKELLGNKKTKAKKFLELGCVLKTDNPNEFVVSHVRGYNKTNHKVYKDENTYYCTCQFNQKVGEICSHIMAVKLYKFMKEWNNKNDI